MAHKDTLNQQVYSGIKTQLLSGSMAPGERLDGRALEERFKVSSTPIRIAFGRLFAERLLEQTPSDGSFHTPYITERWLTGLYVVEDEVLACCVRLARNVSGSAAAVRASAYPSADDFVALAETTFLEIAQASDNFELVAIMRNLNDRLRSVRVLKGELFPDRGQEISAIREAWAEQDISALSSQLHAYHRRRLKQVRSIVAAVDRLH